MSRVMPMALGTRAAAAPSTAIFKVLDLKATASPESSVESPTANLIAPSAEKVYVPLVWRSCTSDVLMVVVKTSPALRNLKYSGASEDDSMRRKIPVKGTGASGGVSFPDL